MRGTESIKANVPPAASEMASRGAMLAIETNGPEDFYSSEDQTLDYLAKILVEAYFKQRAYDRARRHN